MSIIAQAWATLDETPAPIPLTEPEPWQVLAIANKHPYDDFVRFEEEGHRYAMSIDGKRWVDHKFVNSVTKLLNIYVEKFVEQANPPPAMEAQRIRGVKMHALIERYFNGIVPSDTEVNAHPNMSHEWACFLVFAETNKRFLSNVCRTEWAIGDPLKMVVGKLDCFVATERHEDGSPKAGIVIDWKTKTKRYSNKGFTNRSVKFQNCESMNTLEKYETQAFLYARILEERYKIKVPQIMIVTFSQDYALSEYSSVYRPGYSMDEYRAATRGGPVHEAERDRVISYYIHNRGMKKETMSMMVWRMNKEDVESLYEHKRVIHRDYDNPPNKLVRINAMHNVIASSTPWRDEDCVKEVEWQDFDDNFENPTRQTPSTPDIRELAERLEKHTEVPLVVPSGVGPKRLRELDSGFVAIKATPMPLEATPVGQDTVPTQVISTLSQDWLAPEND